MRVYIKTWGGPPHTHTQFTREYSWKIRKISINIPTKTSYSLLKFSCKPAKTAHWTGTIHLRCSKRKKTIFSLICNWMIILWGFECHFWIIAIFDTTVKLESFNHLKRSINNIIDYHYHRNLTSSWLIYLEKNKVEYTVNQ